MHPNSWQIGIVASTVLPATMLDSLQGEQTTVNVHIISTHSTHETEKYYIPLPVCHSSD